MELLEGLNYDYSKEDCSTTTEHIGLGNTILNVNDSSIFAENDYILINPKSENAEIVQVASAPTDNYKVTVSATKFTHRNNIKIWKLSYNQMRFYTCETINGTYTLISGSETDLNYTDLYTIYKDSAANSDYFFKRTFYNEETADESDIDLAESWQIDTEDLPITPQEMRLFLQFDENDYPTARDMRFFIKLSADKISLDVESSNSIIIRLATFLLTKVFILKALSTKAIAKGYITINANGRQVTKAFQELVLDAENTEKEYTDFLNANTRSEVVRTNFLQNTENVSAETREEIINIMTGTQNAIQFDSSQRGNYTRRRRL